MAKYNKAIVDKMAELYETGNYGIKEICEAVGITKETWYDWKEKKPYFSDLLERAHARRLENLGQLALSGMAVLLTKHEYEEVTTEYINGPGDKPKIKSRKVVKKFVMPNERMIEFVATNRMAQEWKHRNNVDHTNNGDSFNFSNFLMDNNTVPDEDPESEEGNLTDDNGDIQG